MPNATILLLARVQPDKLGGLREILAFAKAHHLAASAPQSVFACQSYPVATTIIHVGPESREVEPVERLRELLPLQPIPIYPAELATLMLHEDGQLTFDTWQPTLTGSGLGLAQILAWFVTPGSAVAIITDDAEIIDVGGWYFATSNAPDRCTVVPLHASMLDGPTLEAIALSDMDALTAPVQ